MTPPSSNPVLLFVASEPANPHYPDELARGPSSVQSPSLRVLLEANMVLHRAGPLRVADPGLSDSLPPSQLVCLERLLRAAQRVRRAVRVVDVNRPGEDRELCRRHVGPGDVLPVAVRSDGARLQGAGAFEPRSVREFLKVP